MKYPRGQKFFRKLKEYNEKYSVTNKDLNKYNSQLINSPKSQSRPQTAQKYKRRSASRNAIRNKQSEVKNSLDLSAAVNSQTITSLKSIKINRSSLNSPKISYGEQNTLIPRSQLWFNPPQMTVQKLNRHYHSNSSPNKLKNLHSTTLSQDRIQKDNKAPSQVANSTIQQSQNITSKKKLNLKSILNNMRQQRLNKLKKQIKYQFEKQDQNVINRFELSPTHEMKIWLPYHVKYIDRNQNKLDRLKPGSRLVNQSKFQDSRPNMLQYTLESYIRGLYSPDDIPDNVGKFQNSGSKRLLREMATLEGQGQQNHRHQHQNHQSQTKMLNLHDRGSSIQEVQNINSAVMSPSSRKQGQFILVNSPESGRMTDYQKRAIKDLRQKYVRAASKRNIDQSLFNQDLNSRAIDGYNSNNHSLQQQQDFVEQELNQNLFQRGRIKLQQLAKDNVAHRKEVKKKLKIEWQEAKKQMKWQMPPSFSLQMLQKESQERNKNALKAVQVAAKRKNLKKGESSGKQQLGNVDLNQTTNLSGVYRRSDREYLGYNISKTYGEKLHKLNLAQPNYHDKLKIQFK